MQRSGKHIRVISHVDLDAFYAQVEAQAHPHLAGQEIAVMQYNPFGDLSTVKWTENRVQNDSNGSIIALAYGRARAAGVKRNMRGGEAKRLWPALQLVQVPTSNGKADLTNYRRCGQQVLNVLARPVDGVEVVCEMASIDESYLDVTAAAEHLLRTRGSPAHSQPAHVDEMRIGFQGGGDAAGEAGSQHLDASAWFQRPAGAWDAAEEALAWGAAIVADKRAAVLRELGFTVSAGVAHTKLMAKLCSGLNKPNMQTLLPAASAPHLLRDLPLAKLKGLGGQLGQRLQDTLQIQTAGELAAVPLAKLQKIFGDEDGAVFHEMAHGRDEDPVKARQVPKSIGCGKSFTAHLQIKDAVKAKHWLTQLAQEMEERMAADSAANGRHASLLTLHFSFTGGHKSKAVPLTRHDAAAIAAGAVAELMAWIAAAPRGWAITGLSLSASNFHGAAAKCADIKDLFARKRAPGAAKTARACSAVADCAAVAPPAQSRNDGATAPPCSSVRHGAAAPQQVVTAASDVAAPPKLFEAQGTAEPAARSHAAQQEVAQRTAMADRDAGTARPSVCHEQQAAFAPQATLCLRSTESPQHRQVTGRESSARCSEPTDDGDAWRGTPAASAPRHCARPGQAADRAEEAAAGGEDGAQVAAAHAQQSVSEAHEASPRAGTSSSAAQAPATGTEVDTVCCSARAQQPWRDAEVGYVDATVLAALPVELRSEVYLRSKRTEQPTAASHKREAKRAKRSQTGLTSFLQGRKAGA